MRKPEFYLNNPVISLQTMLRQISDVDPRILPVIPDGLFGPSTYGAVRSFQEAYGLPVTGQVDQQTWNSITDAHSLALAQRKPPVIELFWSLGSSIQPGEQNAHLYLVQAMLTVLSHYYPALTAPPIDGILNPTTAEDLKWIQAGAAIPKTGVLNTLTWNALGSLYRVTVGSGE